MGRSSIVSVLLGITLLGRTLEGSADPLTTSVPKITLIAGYDSTCSIDRQTAAVHCWGCFDANNDCEFWKPQQISEFKGVTAMSGATAPFCVMRPGKAGGCYDSFTHVGNGAPEPESSRAMPAGTIQVSSGAGHTCAVDRQKQAWCWGPNGVLGVFGKRNDDSENPDRLHLIPLRSVKSITVGAEHTCAMTEKGVIWCWGLNEEGQTGLPASGCVPVPTRVPQIPRMTAVEAGSRHTCSLDANHNVWCWGELACGSSPRKLEAPEPIVEVKVGGTVCARAESGRIYCTAAALEDQPSSCEFRLVPALANIVSVAVGNAHICAATTNRDVFCWGENVVGQLGIGSRQSRAEPTLVNGVGRNTPD